MNNRAVLYLRSSKDRSDVSIDAQRRGLQEMAATRNLVIVGEYADAVESGKDDDRPGFQAMLADLNRQPRTWDTVLALDTARIARRRIIGLIFEEQECKRRGVRVLYRSIPDGDPLTEMLIKTIFQGFDEWHSMNSRAKGLAGMAENIRQGWRAGGRAPRGYDLEYVPTGAIRDGVPVTKTRLVANDDAQLVGAFMRGRAAGQARGRIARSLCIEWATTSLIGMEWQALTYAGHTVWNVHAERDGGTAVGGTKRRPREEWLIQRDTHHALITEAEAEAILANLETKREHQVRPDAREYLLRGILVDPTGRPWHGDGGDHYRLGRSRRIAAARIERSVLDSLEQALQAEDSVTRVTNAVRRLAAAPSDVAAIPTLERALQTLGKRISRTVDLTAAAENPEPYLRRVAELEAERTGLIAELSRQRSDHAIGTTMGTITEQHVRAMLATLLDEIRVQQESGAIAPLREALAGLISKVVLDDTAEHCTIHYQLAAPHEGGVALASPAGFEPAYLP